MQKILGEQNRVTQCSASPDPVHSIRPRPTPPSLAAPRVRCREGNHSEGENDHCRRE